MQRESARSRGRRRSISSHWLIAGLTLAVLVTVFGGRLLFHRVPAFTKQGRPPGSSSGEAEAARVRAELPAPAVVTGVVRALAGAPIANARVCATCTACEPLSAPDSLCTTTDSNGRYVLEAHAGAVRVVAAAQGYVTTAALAGAAITLSAGESRSGIDVELALGGASVEGSVVDATGGPVPHARVRGVRAQAPRISLDVESDDRGHFSLTFPEGSLALSAEAPSYAPARAVVMAPTSGVELVLTPAAHVAGAVVARGDGSPVPGVEVRAVPVENPGITVFRGGTSDGEGRFSIDGLAPGSYLLVATSRDARGVSERPVDVALAAAIEDARVVIDRAVEVSGRVVTRAGVPCAQGFATLGPPDPTEPHPEEGPAPEGPVAPAQLLARVEIDGTVRFPGVPRGRYYVGVHCEGSVLREGPRVIDVADRPISGLSFIVGEGGSLLVRALDDLGHPVPFAAFLVKWPRQSPSDPVPLVPGRTGADGTFEYPGVLRPGAYEVSAPGSPSVEPVSVEVRDGTSKVEATLKLPGSAAIVVDVRTERDEPVDGVRVAAIPLEASPGLGAVPPIAGAGTGNGRYRIAPLPPGKYRVQADDGVNPPTGSGASSTSVSRVGPGDEITTRITVSRGGEIHGHVRDDQGSPEPNVWVSAIVDSGSEGDPFAAPRRVLTDAEGRFSIDRLVSDRGARFVVRAERPQGGSAARPAVHPFEDVDLTLPGRAGAPDGGAQISPGIR